MADTYLYSLNDVVNRVRGAPKGALQPARGPTKLRYDGDSGFATTDSTSADSSGAFFDASTLQYQRAVLPSSGGSAPARAAGFSVAVRQRVAGLTGQRQLRYEYPRRPRLRYEYDPSAPAGIAQTQPVPAASADVGAGTVDPNILVAQYQASLATYPPPAVKTPSPTGGLKQVANARPGMGILQPTVGLGWIATVPLT